MAKQERVPETHDVEPNREQRRHPERAPDAAPTREHGAEDETPLESRELTSVRAKSSGHGKKTADKWNQ